MNAFLYALMIIVPLVILIGATWLALRGRRDAEYQQLAQDQALRDRRGADNPPKG